ncbi:D-isomer specific 2-hydroxyacid dehydrogenase [Mycena albidolilacea]|uniref:D-isomer specific 2-hydroxyacid dehydrogenase n=1 Tax=Mycena albidolilacea TaxID=1033008 RepID=A0AAD7A6S7_9AGAR|nr:D-isomer specific 2-hydroxyacid dehydrogenase [Mycena albidolilacea]
MTERRAVLTLGPATYAISEYEAICKRYEVDILPVAELIGHASVTKAVADAVAARAAAGKSPYAAFIWFFEPWVSAPFDENMLSPLTKSGCRLFCGAGAGYDVVDNAWLKTQGAYYCNTPTAFSVSTANGALMLILAATRAASQGDLNARAGKWRGNAAVPGDFLPLGQDIEGMTLGIIGFGSIGKALAVRAQACGMKIIYYNRRRVSESEENGATYVSMDELLATSDVISLSCPLTSGTRHLLGPAEFSKMKTGVFIVNTARGPIIDEEALVQALKSGKVSRVGLDVFEREPIIHPGLLDHSLAYKVTFQPHTTGRTFQAFFQAEVQLFKSLEEFMKGERPEYDVNDPQ